MGADLEPRTPRPRGPSMPTLLVMGALAVVGAITLVQWVVAAFTWLVTLAMLLVVVVGLGWGVLTLLRCR